jgi:RNA polymerase II-associated protein 2
MASAADMSESKEVSQSRAAPKPKGILKKPTRAPAPQEEEDEEEEEEATRAETSRQVALQHAKILQQRRDLADRISDSIISLSKFPLDRSSREHLSSSPTDIASFKSQIRLFQPGDYDDLIEERNSNKLCGYALCSRPRRRVAAGGQWKLMNYGRQDFGIMPVKELEKWCSQACAKQALYIKVQLNETAAMERVGIDSIQIDLLNEKSHDDATERLARELDSLKIEAEKKAMKDAKDLALERGMTGAGETTKAQPNVKVSIREKDTVTATPPSLATDGDDGHLLLDGYKTKFDSKTATIGTVGDTKATSL